MSNFIVFSENELLDIYGGSIFGVWSGICTCALGTIEIIAGVSTTHLGVGVVGVVTGGYTYYEGICKIVDSI